MTGTGQLPLAACNFAGVGGQCRRTATEPDGCCLLHSASSAKAARFWDEINQRINSGNFDFQGYVFPGTNLLPKHLQDADFSGAVFLGQTDFSEAVFHGTAYFTRTAFRDFTT
jgi:uncharacterized protein YjbI with pentapeptide repeats